MSDINEPTNESMAPSLQLSDYRGQRYPNQFFDLSQQYMPPTIKELFRWCTFYYYNSPLIGATLKKVSRYPITDLIFEDDQDSVRDLWDKILVKELKMKERQIEINLDLKVYGNAFVSLHFPFTRFLSCRKCGNKQPMKNWKWDFRGNDFAFSGHCPRCKEHGKVDVLDVPYKDRKGIRVIRWNPENMHIKYNEYTGRYIYMYTVPPKQRNMIMRGDKDILEDTPMIVLEAISKRRMIRLNNDSIFHLKSPTLAEQDQGWGKPDIIHVLKDMFYFYTLRRAQEAIALEHIIPFDVIYPLPNAQQDPYLHTDLGSWRLQIENVIRRHRRDPNFKGVIPVPIGTARIGGDGKMLLLSPELNYLNQTIVGGLGMSQELLFGNGLNYCLDPKSYVFTDKGLVKLEEICPEDVGSEKADFKVATKDAIEKAEYVHHTAERSQVKIRTRIGFRLNGSPIHRVWSLNPDMSMGWVKLEDLKPGMFVATKRSPEIWGSKTPSKELCRLLGHLCADGSVLHGEVIFRSTDTQDLEDFQHCLKTVFDKDISIQTRKYEDQKDLGTVETHDKNVFGYLSDLGAGGYQHEKRVPKIIREATKECVSEFLRALFSGDGCIEDKESKQSIIYASSSNQLLEEVQLLLLNFGIISRRYDGENGVVSRLGISSYNVKKYMEEIGFTLDRKTTLFNGDIQRDDFRCEENKYPYLKNNLQSLRKKVAGNSWLQKELSTNLDKDFYSVKDVMEITGRTKFPVTNYIRSGKLKATKINSGAYGVYKISKEDLHSFLNEYGVYERVEIGNTKCEINSSNINNINWDDVRKLDPSLYERVRILREANHVWDEVVEVSHCSEMIEMCDLTIENTPSYVANGIISHNTGSSITLRMLENDFIQNRSQLIDLTVWVKDKIRIWMTYPDIRGIRFSDFRMADDVQRNQQLIGLNAQGKVSDQTMLTELGYDWDQETQKLIIEAQSKNYIMDIQTKSNARSQGEASIIQANYQKKTQDVLMSGSNAEAGPMGQQGMPQDPNQMQQDPQAAQQPQGGQEGLGELGELDKKIETWAKKLLSLDEATRANTLSQLKQRMPDIAAQIEQAMLQMNTAGSQSGIGVDMSQMPENGMPRRAGAV